VAQKNYDGLDAPNPDKASKLELSFWVAWRNTYQDRYPLRCEYSNVEGWKTALEYRRREKPRSRIWRADFAYPPAKLLIEINGGTFSRGLSGHTSGTGISRDCQKVIWAASTGWATVPLATDMMNRAQIYHWVDLVCRCLEARITTPT